MHTLSAYVDGVYRATLEPGQIAQVIAMARNLLWLDIEDPGDDDIALLRDGFQFHPLAIEDAVRSHERPKVDAYAHYYFVVFYAVGFDPQHDHVITQPLNLFIGANYLVTVHRGGVPQVAETLARWRGPNSPLDHRIGSLVHALLDGIVDEYFPLMDQVADRVDDLEDAIFIAFDQEAIQTIFRLKKDMLSLRRIVSPERDVLNVLLRRELPLFGPEEMAYLQDVYDHIVRVTDSIDTYRDLLSSALDSYLSLQSNRLNEVMKLLTMASIVLMTNALIAGIYGMNFTFMPELQWPFGYPAALGLMLAVSLLLVSFFRRRKWF